MSGFAKVPFTSHFGCLTLIEVSLLQNGKERDFLQRPKVFKIVTKQIHSDSGFASGILRVQIFLRPLGSQVLMSEKINERIQESLRLSGFPGETCMSNANRTAPMLVHPPTARPTLFPVVSARSPGARRARGGALLSHMQ